MASIDERIVAMSFENAKFEAGVAKTMATLNKLNDSLKKIGTTHGLGNIEKATAKINFSGITSALDKLKEKLHLTGATKGLNDVDMAAKKISFGPLTTAIESIKDKLSSFLSGPASALDSFKQKLNFTGADKGLNDIEAASNKVRFAGLHSVVDNLKGKLKFTGVEQNFDHIEKSSGKVKLSAIATAVSNATSQFSVLSGAAAVALGSIASKAAVAGGSLVKGLTVDPLIGGLKEYETNLNSIQTILANTQFQGSTLDDVNKALLQLNKYSDQTIYNFSQMAKNIGTFTAAGVDLKTSVASIKGIANLAALSGSNAEQAAGAMYQLSQAIAAGRVSLQDWNSVVNAGMGGATFQRALATTAEAMGTIAEGALKIDKATGKATINGNSFRESITAKPGEESWLTSDVLTTTLKQFTGDLSDAELAAIGFNKEQIKAIQQTAKTAKLAATEVKTLSGVFDVAKESIGSGWSQTFQLIFGDFEEAKTLFTGVSSAITGFIGASADARNKVLGDWKELGGRTALIEAIKDVFEGLASVIKPLKEAFREIFPKKTGEDLLELTKRFGDFAEKLKIGPDTAEKLKDTFAGFFAVLSIGKTIVGEILGVIGDLVGAASDSSGGFLSLTSGIGDFLVSVDKAIKEGEGLTKFFDGLGKVLAVPIKLLSALAGAISTLFTGEGDSESFSASLDDMESSLTPLGMAIKIVTGAWKAFLEVISSIGDAIGPVVDEIGKLFGGVGESIATAFENADYDKIFAIIQTTLIGGIFLIIKKAFGGGLTVDFGGDLIEGMGKSFKALTGSLTAMQTNIKAGTLLKIAAAVTLLAAGVVALSLIDPSRLASSMTAISVGLGELVAATALLTKIGGVTAFVTMPFIAASLILLAGAIDVLAISVLIFSTLSWEELGKGLLGVAGVLTAVGLAVRLIPPSIVLLGPALLPLAAALVVLAAAVKIFSTLKWEELAKGLIGVAAGLTILGVGAALLTPVGPSMLLLGPALIGVAFALNLLAVAVLAFGKMNLATIGKGLLGIAGALIVIGVAMSLMPPTFVLQAAGLILVGVALTGIAAALALMGGLSIKTIAKGLIAMGLALAVLGTGLIFMSATIPGSIALLAAATALAILAPVLGILGNLKWITIVKGLAAIAGLLATIGVVGLVAAPALAILGAALIVLGGGLLLVGAGVKLLATGLVLLGSDGTKGISAVMVALTALVALLPKIIVDFIKGLVEILDSIADLAPKVVDSMAKILDSLIDLIIKSAPKLALAVTILLHQFIKVIDANAVDVIEAGFRLLLALLSGIDDNIVEVVNRASSIVVKFLETLDNHLPQIIAAGVNVLVEFLKGLATVYPKVTAAGTEIVVKFLGGIAQNIPKIIAAAVDIVVQFVKSLADNSVRLIEAGTKFITKIAKGVSDNIDEIVESATKMIDAFIKAAVKAALDLVDTGATAVINFINGVAEAIRNNSKKLGEAGANLGTAIVEGAITGMGAMAGELVKKALSIFDKLPSAVKKLLKIDSPSKVFVDIGRNVMLGVAVGIEKDAPLVNKSIKTASEDMIKTMTKSLSEVPSLLDGLIDSKPVITPILDLSSVQKSAKELSNLTNVIPITAAASYNQAASISGVQELAQTISEDVASQPVAPLVFEQNNYSPESLSTNEIYRLTKNQLSQAKSVLGL